MMDNKDEIIDCLSYKLRKANQRINELESENRILRNGLDNAEYKIKTELEPRIASEKRSYDFWVTSQAEPKCTCTLGCPYEDTDECLRKYEREEKNADNE